ncbi:MAG: PEP-CTERM sorting domain-containing protein [Pirellulales bacterium]|nr:PEP-CTERM sorting domain-containing protein [Pirellulales bacterium]
MKSSVSTFVVSTLLLVSFAGSSLAAPLVGSGILPFPGPTGNPARDNYLAAGSPGGPFTGTWPGAGPNTAATAWWGTFPVTGPMPHGNTGFTGTAAYDFTPGGGYAPGVLQVGTYFFFGDLDNGAGQNESFRLRAYDTSANLIMTPWLEIPFAASPGSTAVQMPNYNFIPGGYFFDGNSVPGNPSVAVFLKNNTLIGRLEVTRTSDFASFMLAAPPVPEPSSLMLLVGGALSCLVGRRKR